jgi:hypothetical protein
MGRYKIIPGDGLSFKASFTDTECVECNEAILEGTPIGFLIEEGPSKVKEGSIHRSRYGPLCPDCLETTRTPMKIERETQ